MASVKMCSFPHCQEFEDKDRASRLCEAHFLVWIRSTEFIAAARDPEMVFRSALGAKKAMSRLLAAHRRRWAKAQSEREADEVDTEPVRK